MRNIQRFEACWWPILCMPLSVKIQFPGLKRGWSEREASQAVSQVLLSANKSLQNKYLNEKGEKKKLVWPISSSKNSWGGPRKKNVMQREWVLKIRWKLNKLLEKRGEGRGEERSSYLSFQVPLGQGQMPQHSIFSFAKQVRSLANTLSSAGLAKSGRKTFIFKGRQHILVIEPDLLYKQARRANFYIKPITFTSARPRIAK